MTRRYLEETTIIKELADATCEQIVDELVDILMNDTSNCLSGPNSGLKNLWEEICVQDKWPDISMWPTHQSLVWSILLDMVRKLPLYKQEALWLQSEQGCDWGRVLNRDEIDYPLNLDHVVEYLVNYWTSSLSYDYTNENIERYLEELRGNVI